MAATDKRKLEKTSTAGIYRRHAESCKRNGRCRCSYVVRWKERGKGHNRLFPTFELAREFKGEMASGKTSRKPLSSETVGGYYEGWIDNYRGRTARGVQASTVREYKISFKHHILKLPIARTRLRDLTAPDVRDWLLELERRGASPATIKRARIALRVMLACAVQDGDITSNPAAGVRYIPTEAALRRHPQRRRRDLTAADVAAILEAMPEEWRAFFTLLAQSGVRIGELLGLTWGNVHLGDDPHIMVAEQVYRGERKVKLKTDASRAQVPLSAGMASWLAELRPQDVTPDAPVFPSATGGPLGYPNVYNRVLRPALIKAGIAVKVGETEKGAPIWDYQGVAFHRFRFACGSLLLAHGKRPKQVQDWLRHKQLTTTMNVYMHPTDDGVGSADVWDEILPTSEGARVHLGSTGHPETAANEASGEPRKTASQSQTS
jgi:integrase